jgi:hypothetical protein
MGGSEAVDDSGSRGKEQTGALDAAPLPARNVAMATPDSAPHDYIEAEFTIDGLTSAVEEQQLLQAFAGREGIKSMSLSGKKVVVAYEPVLIHKTQIVAAISAAGFRVADVESAPASPIVEAIFEEATTHPAPPASER